MYVCTYNLQQNTNTMCLLPLYLLLCRKTAMVMLQPLLQGEQIKKKLYKKIIILQKKFVPNNGALSSDWWSFSFLLWWWSYYWYKKYNNSNKNKKTFSKLFFSKLFPLPCAIKSIFTYASHIFSLSSFSTSTLVIFIHSSIILFLSHCLYINVLFLNILYKFLTEYVQSDAQEVDCLYMRLYIGQQCINI